MSYLKDKEEDTRLRKAATYPLDKFLKKVCDAEYDGRITEIFANRVVKEFIRLKAQGRKYVYEVEKIEKFMEDFIAENS